MKISKTLKWLTIPTMTAIVSIAPLTLCQCGGKADPVAPEDPTKPTVDPTTSGKVDMTYSVDTESNTICKLSVNSKYKATKKITNIAVKIGSTSLKENEEFTCTGISNDDIVTVKIFKTAKDKYTGSIVVSPTLGDKEQVLTKIEVKGISSSSVGSTIKASNIEVYPYYNDVKSSTQLQWNTGYLIYLNGSTTPISNFSTVGYTFPSKGSYNFTVKAVANPNLISSFTVAVQSQSKTITFQGVHCSLSSQSITVDSDKTWGQITNKPTATPEYGYDSTISEWRINNESGSPVTSSTPVSSISKIYVIYTTLEDVTDVSSPVVIDEFTSVFIANTFVPSENKISAKPYLKSTKYNIKNKYHFKITIGGTSEGKTISEITYFWLYDSNAGHIFKFKDTHNIVSIKHNLTALTKGTDYKIINYEGGSYIEFTTQYSTVNDTLEVELEFHGSHGDTQYQLIPAYETIENPKNNK